MASGTVAEARVSFGSDARLAAVGAAAAAGAQLGSEDAAEAVFSVCAQQLESGQLAGQIVSLNAVDANAVALPHGSLVHVRGMVQDMLSPEYYPALYTGKSGDGCSGMWTDTLTEEPLGGGAGGGSCAAVCPPVAGSAGAAYMNHAQDRDQKMAERKPVVVVGIPGETRWARSEYEAMSRTFSRAEDASGANARAGAAAKRSRDDEANDVDMAEGADTANPPCSNKARLGGGVPPEAQAVDASGRLEEAGGGAVGTQHASGGGGNDECPPLSRYIIKMYDCASARVDSIKLNEAVDFVGVFTRSPELTLFPGDVDEDMAEEMEATHPPSSQVPRIHCLWWRRSTSEMTPRLIATPQAQLTAIAADTRAASTQLRAQTLAVLKSALGGDEIAAEYVLLALLARVHRRADGLTLGNMSVNLTGCDVGNQGNAPFGPTAESLGRAISEIVPRYSRFGVSLRTLNSQRLIPFKDYATNTVVSTPLQVTDGTVLLLDETKMKAGNLNATGTANVHALKEIVEKQQLMYDFQFYQLPMPMDAPAIVLSTTKSIIGASVVVPLRSQGGGGGIAEIIGNLAEDAKTAIRMYLMVARSGDASVMDDATTKHLEADIVSARNEDKSLTADTFHSWMTMARLMALSYGSTAITSEHWNLVRQLERRREERLRVV